LNVETEHNFRGFSPDFKTLVTLGGIGNIRLWDVASGKNIMSKYHGSES
jgi:WD40 repeat protein